MWSGVKNASRRSEVLTMGRWSSRSRERNERASGDGRSDKGSGTSCTKRGAKDFLCASPTGCNNGCRKYERDRRVSIVGVTRGERSPTRWTSKACFCYPIGLLARIAGSKRRARAETGGRSALGSWIGRSRPCRKSAHYEADPIAAAHVQGIALMAKAKPLEIAGDVAHAYGWALPQERTVVD